MKLMRTAAFAALGAGAWAVAEARRYRLQRHVISLDAGIPPLEVLHLSDAHLTGEDTQRVDFIRSLADRMPEPDLILMTGDMIEGDDGIDPLLHALEPLKARYGKACVFGSHDYYRSRFRVPIKYLTGKETKPDTEPTDVQRMLNGLKDQDWIDLTNRSETIAAPFGRILLSGVDDPYLKRHRTEHIRREDAVLAIGLTHAPNVVSTFMLAGYDLVVAGHTHGGQLRAPFFGALVTNSPLPAALAAGPRRIGRSVLHVSPGIGTSRYTRIRFLCPPEVTLLSLRAR